MKKQTELNPVETVETVETPVNPVEAARAALEAASAALAKAEAEAKEAAEKARAEEIAQLEAAYAKAVEAGLPEAMLNVLAETVANAKRPAPVAAPVAHKGRTGSRGPIPAHTSTSTLAIGPNASRIANRETLQLGATEAGAQWAALGRLAPNTRWEVIQTLRALGETFSYAQALAALEPLHRAGKLGTGTPRSYLVEFMRKRYLEVVVA